MIKGRIIVKMGQIFELCHKLETCQVSLPLSYFYANVSHKCLAGIEYDALRGCTVHFSITGIYFGLLESLLNS